MKLIFTRGIFCKKTCLLIHKKLNPRQLKTMPVRDDNSMRQNSKHKKHFFYPLKLMLNQQLSTLEEKIKRGLDVQKCLKTVQTV